MGHYFEYRGLYALPLHVVPAEVPLTVNGKESRSSSPVAVSITRTAHLGSPENEERRLRAEFETATSFYAWAVGELSRLGVGLARDEYDKLGAMVEMARLECGNAHLALETFKNEKSK